MTFYAIGATKPYLLSVKRGKGHYDIQQKLDADTVNTIFASRELLKSEQQSDLVLGNPAVTIRGSALDPSQKAKFHDVMQNYLQKIAQLNRSLDNLEFERTLLYQSATLDEDALLAKQKEINDVNAEIANARIKLAVASRDVLTPEQRKKIFNRHHPQIWHDTGLTPEQDAKIMAIHMKLESADQEGRRELINLDDDLADLYLQLLPDKSKLLETAAKIDASFDKTVRKQLQYVLEARDLLTAEQKRKLAELMVQQSKIKPFASLAPKQAANAIIKKDFDAGVAFCPSTTVTKINQKDIQLVGGEILVSTSEPATVETAGIKIAIQAGTIASITQRNKVAIIRNLCDSKNEAITITAKTHTLLLKPGHQIALANRPQMAESIMQNDSVGVRKVESMKLSDDVYAITSEFSIVSALQNDELLSRMYKSSLPTNKAVMDKVVKMAAVILQTTKQNGPYKKFASK